MLRLILILLSKTNFNKIIVVHIPQLVYHLNFSHLAKDCLLGDQLKAAHTKMKAVGH